MNQVTRAFTAQVDDVNASERSIVAKISTGAIDRYNTVFDARGCDLGGYNGNRVVLWEHGKDPARGSMPIGTNLWIKASSTGPDGKIIAKTRFKTDDFSQQLYEAYQANEMSGWSISAIPTDYGPPTKEEIRNRPDLADVATVYRNFQLLEYSAVAVPGNPECLTTDELRSASRLIARGIPVPDDVRPLVEAAIAAMATEIAGPAPAEVVQDTATADDSTADRNGPGCMDGKAKQESKPAPFAKSDEEDEEEKEDEDNEEEEKEEKKPKRDMDGDPVDENCGGKKRTISDTTNIDAAPRVLNDSPAAPAIIINPTPERAAPAPVLTLPPLEGRSYNVVLMDLIAQARAARVSLTEEFQAYHDWLHGKV